MEETPSNSGCITEYSPIPSLARAFGRMSGGRRRRTGRSLPEVGWYDDDTEEDTEDGEDQTEEEEDGEDGIDSTTMSDSDSDYLDDYIKNLDPAYDDSNDDEDLIFSNNIIRTRRRKSSESVIREDPLLKHRRWLLDCSRLHQAIVAFISASPSQQSLQLGMINRQALKPITRVADCYQLQTTSQSIKGRRFASEIAITLRRTDCTCLPKPRNRIYARIEQQCTDSDREKQIAIDKYGFIDDDPQSYLIWKRAGATTNNTGGEDDDDYDYDGGKKSRSRDKPVDKKNRIRLRDRRKAERMAKKNGGRGSSNRQSDPVEALADQKGKSSTSSDRKGKSSTSTSNTAGKSAPEKYRHGSVVGAAASPIGESNVGHKLLQKMGWHPGDSLGNSSKETAIKDPVVAIVRTRGRGLGYD